MSRHDPEKFIIADQTPAYLDTAVRESLPDRVQRALTELRSCCACPRDCGVDRMKNETGFCNIGRLARVSSAFPHTGEEDPLRGWRGSGTIFLASCNLRCVFCQNWDISQTQAGRECTAEELAAIILSLQSAHCHNINFVTPEHVAPQIVEALTIAIDNGLTIPIVYNTSAYDAISSLKLMEGLVDIYMPDFKFWDSGNSKRLCKARDYPERAREAIKEMHRQVGDLRMTTDGIACRGLLVRHLVMPGGLEESAAIFDWLAREISPDTYINIMAQYRPEHDVPGDARYADINRRPTRAEISAAYEAARAAGLWRFDDRASH